MAQQSLQQLIMDRLKIPFSPKSGTVTQLIVDNKYSITLDFSDNQIVILAVIIQLSDELEVQKSCFRRVATACLNLAHICREQVYLDAEKRLMLKRIMPQSGITLPNFEQLLQDFLNTLSYLVGITRQL